MTHLPLIAAIFGKESMPTCWTPNEVATFMIEETLDDFAHLVLALRDHIDVLEDRIEELKWIASAGS